MRKIDLANKVSQSTHLLKIDALIAIEQVVIEIQKSLAKGDAVHIRGFGSFIIKKRAAKIGRNVKKDTEVKIPEHHVPAFKPAKSFKKIIRDLN